MTSGHDGEEQNGGEDQQQDQRPGVPADARLSPFSNGPEDVQDDQRQPKNTAMSNSTEKA